jgi:polysaccharide pyruvyl transferase WcaK-like protein
MTKDTLTIGLLWHSITSDNLGVGALTLSQMALLTRAAARKGKRVQFIVIGTRGGTPYPIDQFKVLATAEFALRAFKSLDISAVTLLRKCDLVFDIGEGDSFADIYGIKRLTMQVLAKVLTRLQGKRLVLSPQTIGPFKTPMGRRLGKVGMRAATRVYARDHLSSDYVRELGFEKKLDEVIDVAFALPFEARTKDPLRRRVGINVSGLMMQDGKQFGMTVDYPALIDGACRFFLEQADVDVYLVPHVISDAHEIEDDLRASQKLQQKHSRLKLAPRFKNPSEAKTFISGLDFFTGARMHACIAAFSSGVPVVPMAYSRKFNGLFSSLGYGAVLDCLKLSTDEALHFLASGWEGRHDLQAGVDAGNALAQAKLNKYVDDVVSMLSM